MYKFDFDWFAEKLLANNIMAPINVSETKIEDGDKIKRGLSFEVWTGVSDRYNQFAVLDEDGYLDEVFGGTTISELVGQAEELYGEDDEIDESLVTYMKLVELILDEFKADVEDEMNMLRDVWSAIYDAINGRR